MATLQKLSVWTRFARRLHLPGQRVHGVRFLKLVDETRERVREIPPEEAVRKVGDGAILIDVRERGEYLQRHITGADHLGRGTIELEIEDYAPDVTTPIVCYCSGGNRSVLVADSLERMGYQNVEVITGGLKAWIQTGLPTSSEREVMD
jgi:rhodanese-related sulfurtransferase